MKRFHNRSLAVRIALILSLLIFISVAFFSALILLLTRRAIAHEREKELTGTLDILENGLRTMRPNQSAPEIDGVPYYILYRISYSDGKALRTNDPAIPLLPPTEGLKPQRYFINNFFTDGNLNLLYIAKTVSLDADTGPDAIPGPAYQNVFHFQVAIDMDTDSTDALLAFMPIIFLSCCVPIMFFSWLISVRTANRMLMPLRRIIAQARDIGSEHLDRRLDEGGADDELKELAHAFNELFSRLEIDFERQRRFSSDVSHELKTPIAVISGYVDMLIRWGKDDPAVLSEALGVLKRESLSMKALTENLLKLNRTENAQLIPYELKPLDLHDFLLGIQKDFELISPEVQLSIDCAEDAAVLTDEEGLKEVLRIIIRNSILYSESPACIRLTYREGELTVADRGQGIPEEDLPHIFDRFYRVDKSRNRAKGGSGLGLSIARAVLARMNAHISVSSVLGKGTEMTIHFPEQ